jgi:hypothetical protein
MNTKPAQPITSRHQEPDQHSRCGCHYMLDCPEKATNTDHHQPARPRTRHRNPPRPARQRPRQRRNPEPIAVATLAVAGPAARRSESTSITVNSGNHHA